MSNPDRYWLEWPQGDGLLTAHEPTQDEVRAAAPLLAHWYNEPVNRALLTNNVDLQPAEVAARFDELGAAGDRPLLLLVDGRLVGDCDLRHLETDRAEYAVLVGARELQAKGLGGRFTAMVLALAFGPLGLDRVYISVIPGNQGSLRMFTKLGFTVDDSVDARRYAEVPEEICLSLSAAALRSARPELFTQVRIRLR